MRLLGSLLISVLISACGGGGGGTDSSSNGSLNSDPDWSIDTSFVMDGGPGKDGIPALDSPSFLSAENADFIDDSELVIGTKINGVTRAFPHSILNWHEIVNIETGLDYHTLSYCPLTGSAALWTIPSSFNNKTFGVSGLLYNSNLILYDRETDSNWPQMLGISANGALEGQMLEKNVVVETTWASWKLMYPETTILSNNTGFSRDYNIYPYGNYLSSSKLLYAVANTDDRLHEKTRVLAINQGGVNKVYPLADFSNGVEVINEDIGSVPFVVVGSSQYNFALAFDSTLSDGTRLSFSNSDLSLPVVMKDGEGNQWNAFGEAVSGPRTGQKLNLKSDFIAFWFAWVAIHPNADIHPFN